MTLDHILGVLREEGVRLRSEGVQHIALFGSRARGDHDKDSDVDLLIHFDPDAGVSLFDLVKWKRELSGALKMDVQIITAPVTKPRLREAVERDAIYAF